MATTKKAVTKKKKSRRMDRKLVAAKQEHEIATIARKFNIPAKVVRPIVKKHGRSRVKVYEALLLLMKYEVK